MAPPSVDDLRYQTDDSNSDSTQNSGEISESASEDIGRSQEILDAQRLEGMGAGRLDFQREEARGDFGNMRSMTLEQRKSIVTLLFVNAPMMLRRGAEMLEGVTSAVHTMLGLN